MKRPTGVSTFPRTLRDDAATRLVTESSTHMIGALLAALATNASVRVAGLSPVSLAALVLALEWFEPLGWTITLKMDGHAYMARIVPKRMLT